MSRSADFYGFAKEPDVEALQEDIEDLQDMVDTESARADENERILVNLFHALVDADINAARAIWLDEPTLQQMVRMV